MGTFRVKSLDGSTLKLPDTMENAKYFGYPKNEKKKGAYPQIRMVSLVDLGTRAVEEISFGPFLESELALAQPILNGLESGIFLIADRLYYSKRLVNLFLKQKVHFLLRIREKINFKTVQWLGPGDEIVKVEYTAGERKKNSELPPFRILRLISYTSRGQRRVRLLTDLLNPLEYPASFLGHFYWNRWGIETVLLEIKHILLDATTVTRPCHLRSKTPTRIFQEIYGVMIVYNILRAKMANAAAQKSLDPRRLSFTACLENFRINIYLFLILPEAEREKERKKETPSFTRILVPERPGRSFRREVKVQRSSYPVKTKGVAS